MIKKLFLASALSLFIFSNAQSRVPFQENFDPATAALWENVDRDGDGEKWEFYNAEEDDVPAFTGGFATSWSWFLQAFTPDNALISPIISVPTTEDRWQLEFKVGAFDEELFQEHYAVYVIPANSTFTGTENPIFEETLDAGYTQQAKTVSVALNGFDGQDVKLVFRHYNCTDIAFLAIDDVKIQEVPGLNVSNSKMNHLQIYPNPTSDILHIKNTKNFDFVRIYDLSGRLVIESKLLDINVQNLSKGEYILNIHTGSTINSQKFIKK